MAWVELKFAGEASEECLICGPAHLTVRPTAKYQGKVVPGSQIWVLDMENEKRGAAWVTGSVDGVTFELFEQNKDIIKMERTPFQTPTSLIDALVRFYPDSTEFTPWTFITFRTYLAEIV